MSWDTSLEEVTSIEEIPADERLAYLQGLPPGHLREAIVNATDLQKDGMIHDLMIAIESLSRIERLALKTKSIVRKEILLEARGTIEAVLPGLVDYLNDFEAGENCCPCGDC